MHKNKSETSDNKNIPATVGIWNKPPAKKRLVQWLLDYKWPLTALIWILALALGFIGYSKYYVAAGQTASYWDVLYRTLQLSRGIFTTLSGPINPVLQVARFLAPAVAIYTILQALAGILHSQIQALRIRFIKDHIIICGLGRKGSLLADRHRALGERIIVIDSNENNTRIKHCEENGAIVLIGDATDPQLLYKAKAHKAKCIISVCSSDGVNAEVAVYARQIANMRKGRTLSCLVHVVDLQLWRLFREREIRMGRFDVFRLGFFNIYESGSRALLYEYPPFNSLSGQESTPRIIVVGIGRLGESVVVNAARRWRDNYGAGGKRLSIIMIDKNSVRKKESLLLKYPQLDQVCELIPLEIDVNSNEFDKAEFLSDSDKHCRINVIYVCLGNDSVALTAALKLHQRSLSHEIPIVVRMEQNDGLTMLLHESEDNTERPRNIHAFPLLEQTCTPDLIWGDCTYEILARAIHEDYLLSCKKRGETPQTNRSMVPWSDLTESLKESNRKQAEHIIVKLECFGYDLAITTDWDPQAIAFSPEEAEEMAKMEHERFVEERLRDGWKYGAVKDIEKKINPTLVSWDKLSAVEKDKDRTAVLGIPAFLARVGYQVYRSKKLS